jgi:hypothetical protein
VSTLTSESAWDEWRQHHPLRPAEQRQAAEPEQARPATARPFTMAEAYAILFAREYGPGEGDS